MRKWICSVALLGIVASTAAYAASPKHTAPGTPGTKNCVGQTMAYLAQGNDAVPGPGIGNVASQAGLTVQEVKAIVAAYCGS